MNRLGILTLLTLAACASRSKIQALEERLATVEARMALVGQVLELPSDPERENEANLLAAEAQAAMDAMDMVKARAIVVRLSTEYQDTTMGRAAAQVLPQLTLVGSEVGPFEPAGWVRGSATIDPKHTTVLVFFEAWCPHCQREVPNVQKTWTKLRERGLDVIGITSFSRDTTDAQMAEFLDNAGAQFPIARDDGTLGARFAAEGVPHAAVLRDGRVAWIGHPASLDEGALVAMLPP